MLGLALLYWIGKYFYKLSDEYDKSKWGFTILGIVIYYSGSILFGIILVVIAEVFSPGYTDTFNETLLGLIAIPFGLLSSYLLYKYLEKTWKKNDPRKNNMINQIGEIKN